MRGARGACDKRDGCVRGVEGARDGRVRGVRAMRRPDESKAPCSSLPSPTHQVRRPRHRHHATPRRRQRARGREGLVAGRCAVHALWAAAAAAGGPLVIAWAGARRRSACAQGWTSERRRTLAARALARAHQRAGARAHMRANAQAHRRTCAQTHRRTGVARKPGKCRFGGARRRQK